MVVTLGTDGKTTSATETVGSAESHIRRLPGQRLHRRANEQLGTETRGTTSRVE